MIYFPKINTPYRIRRALVNTASKIDGVELLSQGSGLLQVGPAFEHVISHSSNRAFGMRFDVKLPQLYNGHARGIYLREPYQTEDPSVFKVYLEPSYKEDTSVLEKQTFTCSLSLKSTATWLQAASHYHFANGRGFEVRVDSSGMKPGHYFAEVEAYDTTAPFTAGALLRIPVTVVIPQYLPPLAPSPSFSFGVLSFRPGQLHRKYVKVPIGATWVDFNIRAGNTWGGGDSGSNRRLNVIHCQQLLGELAHRNSMLDKYFWMQAGMFFFNVEFIFLLKHF